MHELAICTALVSQVVRVAAAEDCSQVRKVTLCIGPLSGIEPTQLCLAFPLVASGTPCEGAEIEIECRQVRVRCRSCGQDSEALPNRLLCLSCGGWQVDLISGDEMLLLRVAFFDQARAHDREPVHV